MYYHETRKSTKTYSDTSHFVPQLLIWLLRLAITQMKPTRAENQCAKSKDSAKFTWWERHPSTAECAMQMSVSGSAYAILGRSLFYRQIAQAFGNLSNQKWYRKPLNQDLVIKRLTSPGLILPSSKIRLRARSKKDWGQCHYTYGGRDTARANRQSIVFARGNGMRGLSEICDYIIEHEMNC